MAKDRKDTGAEEPRQKQSILIFLTSLFSFLNTLPGIITGAVALIAAITGIFRVTQGHFPFTPSPHRSQSAVTGTAIPPATQTPFGGIGTDQGPGLNLPPPTEQPTQNGNRPQLPRNSAGPSVKRIATAVASWGSNRLDIFALGTNGEMYHKAWQGRWFPSSTSWEALDGTFSSP